MSVTLPIIEAAPMAIQLNQDNDNSDFQCSEPAINTHLHLQSPLLLPNHFSYMHPITEARDFARM
jgi:hypothetical protein